jgi:HlyD family secretion protein
MIADRTETPVLTPLRPKRRMVWIVTAVLVVAGITWAVWPKHAKAFKVKPYTVEKRDVAESLRIAGAIEPLGERPIVAEVAGFITQLHVQAGDRVKRGQVVAHLTDPDLSRQLDEAREALVQSEKSDLVEARFKLADARNVGVPNAHNGVSQARLSLTEAEGELAMKQMLFDAKAESRINLDSARAKRDKSRLEVQKAEGEVRAALLKVTQADNALKLAEAKMAAAKAKVANLEEKVSRLIIRAPQDGLVSRLKVLTGQQVALGAALYDLADDTRQVVSVEVNELDAVKVQTGQSVIVTTSAIPEAKLLGRISLITPIAEKVNRRNEYNSVVVKAVLDKVESRLKSGSTVRTEIILQEKKQVPALALEAVASEAKDKKAVWQIGKEQKATKKSVKTGIADPQYIEIVSGLTVGEQVVASQSQVFEEGARLEIDKGDDANGSDSAGKGGRRRHRGQ